MIVATGDSIHGHEIIEPVGIERGIEQNHTLIEGPLDFRAAGRRQVVGDQRRSVGSARLVTVYATSSIASGASEMLAYGTAVRLKKNGD